MFKVRFLRVIVLLLLFYVIEGSRERAMGQGYSDEYAQSPTVQIKSTVDQTIKILTDPSLHEDAQRDQRHQLARKVILPRFDFNEMARRSLGSHWRLRTHEEHRRFVRVFTELLEKTYLARIDDLNGGRFTYTGEKIDRDYAEVGSKVLTSKGQEFTINYKLHLVGNDWKIYDVVVENISLVNNYRSQFSRIIAKSSYEELVSRIEQKLAEGREVNPNS